MGALSLMLSTNCMRKRPGGTPSFLGRVMFRWHFGPVASNLESKNSFAQAASVAWLCAGGDSMLRLIIRTSIAKVGFQGVSPQARASFGRKLLTPLESL